MARREHSILRTALRTALILGVLAASLPAAGCRKSFEQEPELEAVDVAPSLQIGTESDQTAVVRPPALVGVLPGDFPADLPLYLPASLIDFGTVDGGWVYVSLLTPHSLARVESDLFARLAQRGWAITASGGSRQLRRGNSRVRLLVEDARPGTLIRFEYPG